MPGLGLQSGWVLKVKILYERNLQNSAVLGRSLLTFLVYFKIRLPGKVKKYGSQETDQPNADEGITVDSKMVHD